jgi:aryl-alcohol dehydrogenase-like predicted oxidoreductase
MPWEEMTILRTQGKIFYVGSSNLVGWHIAQAQDAATARHALGLVSEQSIYNLLARDIELESCRLLATMGSACSRGHHRTGVCSATGARYTTEQFDRHRPALERYENVCAELGTEPAHVAIAWLLSRPGVRGPVIGPRDTQEFDGAVRALELELNADAVTRLDDIFPCRLPAPEHYAF